MKENSIALCHTIGTTEPPGPVQPWIQKRIFRGGVVPSLNELIKPIQEIGLICGDIEFINPFHYQKNSFIVVREISKK